MSKTQDLALYYYNGCGFCRRVLQKVDGLNIELELKDTLREPANRQALIEGGGKSQVPCLRIDHGDHVQWMYESADIMKYLENRFG